MLLHLEVIFNIDNFKESDFDAFLNLWGNTTPKIGVSGWGKVGKTKSQLRG